MERRAPWPHYIISNTKASGDGRGQHWFTIAYHIRRREAGEDALLDLLVQKHATNQQDDDTREQVRDKMGAAMDTGVRPNPHLQQLYQS